MRQRVACASDMCGLLWRVLVSALILLSIPGQDAYGQTGAVDIDALSSAQSYAEWVSDTGVVAGRRFPPNEPERPFVWTQELGMVDISLGGTYAHIGDLSPSGILVGDAALPNGQSHAFVWTREQGLQDIGTLGGPSSAALAVSDNGVVIGTSEVDCPPDMACGTHIFVWTSGGGFVDLSTLIGLTFLPKGAAAALVYSSRGMVAGTYQLVSGDSHAFAWTLEHGLTDLGTLGGTWSTGLGVNAEGAVIGESALPGGTETRSFLWTRAGGMTSLGTLGGLRSLPTAISDTGIVVGKSLMLGEDPSSITILTGHAFKWTSAEGMIDLARSEGAGSVAEAVSDDGVVGGRSWTFDNTEYRPFAWSELGIVQISAGSKAVACKAGFLFLANRCVTTFAKNGVVATRGGVVWSRSTGVVELSLGGSVGSINAISSTGIVVGAAATAAGAWRPIVWTKKVASSILERLKATLTVARHTP